MSRHGFHFGALHDTRGLPLDKRGDCQMGGMYKSPLAGEVVKVEDEFTVAWDTSCMSPVGDSVNISLYNMNTTSNNAQVHTWAQISWSRGSFTTNLDPTWYGSMSKVSLQVNIQDSSIPPFMSSSLAGPTFQVTYDAKGAVSASLASLSAAGGTPTPTASATASTTASKWEVVGNFLKHGLSKGQIAAAVVMPILVVASFLIGYIIWNRKRETTKRKEWREKMDQRMSTISVDWKAMSAAGGQAAVRQSMAADRNTRTSSFFGRPNSQFASEGRMTSETNRASRISFAAETYSRPLRPAVPPLPAAYRKSALSYYEESPEASGHATPHGTMSPTQRQGAFVLDDDSIRNRLSTTNDTGDLARDLAAMPAIAMMHNDRSADRDDDNISSPITPMAPALTREQGSGNHRVYSIGAYSGGTDSMIDNRSVQSYFSNVPAPSDSSDPDQALRKYAAARAPAQPTASPFAGFSAGPGLAAAAGLDMSSPDAIFRAYAATRPAQPPVAVTANATGNVMRTLYGNDRNPYRDSMNGGHGDEIGRAN